MSGTVLSGGLSAWLETQLLQHSLGLAAMQMPGALYLALSTTAPTATVAGTPPPAGVAYSRLQTAFALVSGSSNQAANPNTMEWPAATGDWGTIGWAELYDDPVAGNRYYWGPLVDPSTGVPIMRLIQTGSIMRVPAGALIITIVGMGGS